MIWQTILAYAIVSAAAIWLVRHALAVVRSGLKGGRAPGGACAGCVMKRPEGQATKVRPLVQIGGPKAK